MQGFAERLRMVIGLESLSSFGSRCGLSDSLLHKYLKGSVPGMDKLVQIAQAAGVSLDWLATGAGSRHSPEWDYVFVPLYEVSASAGGGSVVDSEAEVSSIAFHPHWIRQHLRVSPQHLQMIFVRGESMEPTLSSGDLVLLDRRATEVNEGIYVLRLDGCLFVKRLHLLPGRQIKIQSDNPSYESFVIDAHSPPEDFEILGRVLWSSHVH